MTTLSPALASQWIEDFLLALAKATDGDPLLNHQEGHFNLAVANVLLSAGATLQFGTTNKEAADFFSLAENWSQAPRVHKLAQGSGDLTITSPAVVCLELKCRPDFGPKAQAAFPEIAEDLDRVINDSTSAFLFSFDERLYASFDGSAKQTKKSTTGDLLRAFFPGADRLAVGKVLSERRSWADTPLDVWALETCTSVKRRRVFVFGRLP